MDFEPCSGCARHVRVTDARCPFCDRARAQFVARDHDGDRPHNVSRAAILLASSLALSGCDQLRERLFGERSFNRDTNYAPPYGMVPQVEFDRDVVVPVAVPVPVPVVVPADEPRHHVVPLYGGPRPPVGARRPRNTSRESSAPFKPVRDPDDE